ncbi:MAG: ATPase [Oscillospiraceae bacterium]|nr:ATPase [Oscillospiraceae bacterium]
MTIDDILNMMDNMLDDASAVMFSSRNVSIDREKMRDCINDLRLTLPDEIRNAKNIVRDRKEIISVANREAEQIVRRAEERAKMLISNDEITKAAQRQAAEIITQAQAQAKDIRGAANKYIDDVLHQTETLLQANLSEVKKKRQDIRNIPSTAARKNQQ